MQAQYLGEQQQSGVETGAPVSAVQQVRKERAGRAEMS